MTDVVPKLAWKGVIKRFEGRAVLDGKPVEKEIFLPHEIITKDNISECDAAIGR